MNNLFVYGTLKRGFRLNRFLESCTYVGDDVAQGFTLFDSGYWYPIAVKSDGDFVSGELYRVHDGVMDFIDSIELPCGYIRREVKLDSGKKAFMYYRDTTYKCMTVIGYKRCGSIWINR